MVTAALLLDQSAAFDTVEHNILYTASRDEFRIAESLTSSWDGSGRRPTFRSDAIRPLHSFTIVSRSAGSRSASRLGAGSSFVNSVRRRPACTNIQELKKHDD